MIKYKCDNCEQKLDPYSVLYYFPHENSLLCKDCIIECSGELFSIITEKYYYERCEIGYNGDIFWRNKKGRTHRLNGPAYERHDGYKAWYLNRKRHREDGPARIWPNGRKEYYINDRELTEKEFNEWKLKNENILCYCI